MAECWGQITGRTVQQLVLAWLKCLWATHWLETPTFSHSYLSHAGPPHSGLGCSRRPPALPADALPSPGSPRYAPLAGLSPQSPRTPCAPWPPSVPPLMTQSDKDARTEAIRDHITQSRASHRTEAATEDETVADGLALAQCVCVHECVWGTVTVAWGRSSRQLTWHCCGLPGEIQLSTAARGDCIRDRSAQKTKLQDALTSLAIPSEVRYSRVGEKRQLVPDCPFFPACITSSIKITVGT